MRNIIGLSVAYALGGERGLIAKLIDILLEMPNDKQEQQRLNALEDPILALDDKIEAVCLVLYEAFMIKKMPGVSYVSMAIQF